MQGGSVSLTTRMKLARAFGGDLADWFRDCGEPMLEAVAETTGVYIPRPSDTSLPVTGSLRADRTVEAEEDQGEAFPCLAEHAAVADYVVRVEGYSMYPELKLGDYVAIKRTHSAQIGDIVVAQHNGDTFIKRLAERRGRRLVLRSDNPEYPMLEGDDINIIGVVVWQHRPAEAIRRGAR